MAQAPGLSVNDLTSRAQASTLRRNGMPSLPVDEVQQALTLRHKALADKIIDKTVSEMGLESMQAKNEQLRLEIEAKQLKEEANPTHPQDDGWKDYLFEQLKTLDARLADANQRLTDQQLKAFADRTAMLESEIRRMQDHRAEPVDEVEAIKGKLESYKAIVELMVPRAMETPPPPGDDPALRAWERRMDSEDERWKLTREDKHNEALAELELKREVAQAEVTAKTEYYRMLGRAADTTLPRIVTILELFANKFLAGTPVADLLPNAAAAAVPDPAQPAPQPAPQVNLQPGMKATPCEVCKTRMIYRETQTSVICSNCGTEYQITPDPPAANNHNADPEGIA